MPFGIGTPELLILAGIFVLLFGASRLPSLMRNMGRSVNEFKQGLKDEPKDAGADSGSRIAKETDQEQPEKVS